MKLTKASLEELRTTKSAGERLVKEFIATGENICEINFDENENPEKGFASAYEYLKKRNNLGVKVARRGDKMFIFKVSSIKEA